MVEKRGGYEAEDNRPASDQLADGRPGSTPLGREGVAAVGKDMAPAVEEHQARVRLPGETADTVAAVAEREGGPFFSLVLRF